MPPPELKVQDITRFIDPKQDSGTVLVCDAENHCHVMRSLDQAEQELEGMERG